MIGLVIILTALPLLADRVPAEITSIHDGDTEQGGYHGHQGTVTMRTAGIDCPELKAFNWPAQPGGEEARAAALKFASAGKNSIEVLGNDRYGRLLVRLYAGRTDVGAKLVRLGYCWASPSEQNAVYAKRMSALQRLARKNKRGIWGAGMPPVAPWIWRREFGDQ